MDPNLPNSRALPLRGLLLPPIRSASHLHPPSPWAIWALHMRVTWKKFAQCINLISGSGVWEGQTTRTIVILCVQMRWRKVS